MSESIKISLRAVEPSDADFMYEVENDTSAWRYSDTIAPLSRRILREYALNYDADPFSAGQIRFIVTDASTNAPVGIIDLYDISQKHLHAYAGIYICKKSRGKGYAEEALRQIEHYAGNTLHLNQLGAKIEEGHEKAINLFASEGYSVCGKLDRWINTPDGFTAMLILTKKL